MLSSLPISINLLNKLDIPKIVKAFGDANWHKSTSLFEIYLEEQYNDERLIWVAYYGNQIAGYVTLKWKSYYEQFATTHIPEIMDLNVLPIFRNKGIGSKLLEHAEHTAKTKSSLIGIGVGLYGGSDGGYGPAQRLYVHRGYIPDGKGITYNYKYATAGNSFPLDDELILWLIKKLN